MRLPKEIQILLFLLLAMIAGVSWYVVDRRAKNRAAAKPVAGQPIQPAQPAAPVALGGANERKTIDFSSGQPVVKDTPEDKAAIDAALKDIAEATKTVTFEGTAKPPAPEKKP